MSRRAAAGPLDGVRVLDLTDERAIFGAKLLADLGACTLRPEPPGGDPLRGRGPFAGEGPARTSLWYTYFGSNRASVVLDLTDPADAAAVARLRALCVGADIVLDCGLLERLEIAAAELHAANPALVIVRVSSFGSGNPLSSYRAPDLVAGALGGSCALSGEADGPPLGGYGELNFLTSGSYAAIAALAALNHARARGGGQVVELSTHEAIASCLENVFLQYWYHDKLQPGLAPAIQRQGSLHSTGYFQVMQAQAGAVLVTSAPDAMRQIGWLAEEDAAEELLRPEFLDTPRGSDFYGPLFAVLRRWAATKDATALFAEGQARHLAYGKVATVPEVAANPHLEATDWWVEYPLPSGSVRGPGAPLHFGETPWQPPAASLGPGSGEQILAEIGWED